MAVFDGTMVRICCGPRCGVGGEENFAAAEAHLEAHPDPRLRLTRHFCFGRCPIGPNVAVERWREGKLAQSAQTAAFLGQKPRDVRFAHRVAPSEVPGLLEAHRDGTWADEREDDAAWAEAYANDDNAQDEA